MFNVLEAELQTEDQKQKEEFRKHVADDRGSHRAVRRQGESSSKECAVRDRRLAATSQPLMTLHSGAAGKVWRPGLQIGCADVSFLKNI